MDDIKPGTMFLHSRFIDTARNPERCKITRVTAATVYYRVGVDQEGNGGSKYRLPRGSFPDAVELAARPADTRTTTEGN